MAAHRRSEADRFAAKDADRRADLGRLRNQQSRSPSAAWRGSRFRTTSACGCGTAARVACAASSCPRWPKRSTSVPARPSAASRTTRHQTHRLESRKRWTPAVRERPRAASSSAERPSVKNAPEPSTPSWAGSSLPSATTPSPPGPGTRGRWARKDSATASTNSRQTRCASFMTGASQGVGRTSTTSPWPQPVSM